MAEGPYREIARILREAVEGDGFRDSAETEWAAKTSLAELTTLRERAERAERERDELLDHLNATPTVSELPPTPAAAGEGESCGHGPEAIACGVCADARLHRVEGERDDARHFAEVRLGHLEAIANALGVPNGNRQQVLDEIARLHRVEKALQRMANAEVEFEHLGDVRRVARAALAGQSSGEGS